MAERERTSITIAIVGQTASGKTDLALDLAQSLGGVIVSADAMQLYRGLDVGTAKTPEEDRRGIPHFQIDQLDVTEEASVAAYQRHARSDIRGVGDVPVVVAGGSGLYLRALLEPLKFPSTDPALRESLNQQLAELGSNHLHERLREVDPVAAARIHPNNGRRVVRALEVIEATGRPFSAQLPEPSYYYPRTVQMGVSQPPEELERRIARRAAAMFADGIVDEAALLEGLPDTATAAKAIGYREARQVLRGELSVPEAVESVTISTRQLAARQKKWFRRDSRIHWLEPGPDLLDQALRVLSQDDSEALA